MIKLILLELGLGVIALACVCQMLYLGWLSATPVTNDRLRVIRIEYCIVLTILALVVIVAIALPFVCRRRRSKVRQ